MFGKKKYSIPIKKKIYNQPEDYFWLKVTDDFVSVTHDHRPYEKIFWNDVEEIKLIKVDEGPDTPDIWLLLLGDNNQCSVPKGAEGYDKVFEMAAKLEGFDEKSALNPEFSREKAFVDLWKKQKINSFS